MSGRPAPAINVSQAIARVEFEPAGSCAVHTIDPSARDNAPTPPPNVVVNTRSPATVAPPSGICGNLAAHSCLPVATSRATISPLAPEKLLVPTTTAGVVYVVPRSTTGT